MSYAIGTYSLKVMRNYNFVVISNLNPCSQGSAGTTSMGVKGMMDRQDLNPGRWRSRLPLRQRLTAVVLLGVF